MHHPLYWWIDRAEDLLPIAAYLWLGGIWLIGTLAQVFTRLDRRIAKSLTREVDLVYPPPTRGDSSDYAAHGDPKCK